MPKATIEGAIARGQGVSLSGAKLEPVTIEAMLPPSVAVVIECMTDQKARTLQEIRHIIKEAGGTVTHTSYLFEKKGKIVFEKKDGLNVDDYLEVAIDAGAVDVDTDDEGRLTVLTDYAETKSVCSRISQLTGLMVDNSEIIWDPNGDTTVTVDCPESLSLLRKTVTLIQEDHTVQEIYSNCLSFR